MNNDIPQWSFTVVRTKGLHLIRPDLKKSWRPIVTLVVDSQHHHEIVLGVDGQNPNLRVPFCLQDANLDSQVDINVWHRSESKKKGKKRTLIATACHSLGELLKKQDQEFSHKRTILEVPLQCQSLQKKKKKNAKIVNVAKGKLQNVALLQLRLRPPPSLRPSYSKEMDDDETCDTSDDDDDKSSVTLTEPPTPASDIYEPKDDTKSLRKRRPRRIRSYLSDSEPSSSEDDSDENKPLLSESDDILCDFNECWEEQPIDTHRPPSPVRSASLLPTYTEEVCADPVDDASLTTTEWLLSTFTWYKELKEAKTDPEYQKVFTKLQAEWNYMGGFLTALTAIDAGIFAISPDSLFPVGSLARYAIASSSAAVVVGIACDVWLLFRYGWVEQNTCKDRAVDIFDSYMFFSLSARLPTLSALFSTITLMLCIGSLAYDAFPVGVAVVFFLFGILITLQFLVYGMRWFARAIARVIGGASKLVSRLWTSGPVESKLERSPTVATVATTASTSSTATATSSTITMKEVGI